MEDRLPDTSCDGLHHFISEACWDGQGVMGQVAREVQATDETDGWGAFEPVGEPNPEARFYETFLDAEITTAIDNLPDEYRAAVVLSDIHELRYAEIAHILGVPEGTVKSRLFRGRRILQKKLVGYAMDMGYIKSVPEAA